MEIKIVSTEIIKPSSPTPHNLRTHKLFLPNDNGYPHPYFSMTLFYSAAGSEDGIKTISSRLKNSLSKTLTYYYPLAGQIKDGVYTDCNDHGAPFIETQIAEEMTISEVLQKKDTYLLKQLLPLNGRLQEIETTYGANIVLQVNYFSCGGIAISICFNHSIVDAAAAVYFVKSWADVARGVDDIKNVIVDYTSIYPPHDALASTMSLYKQNAFLPLSNENATKMFKFDGKSIAALREKISNGLFLDRPTRFEAISTLISSAIINTTAERDELTAAAATQLAVVIAINLRNKLNPPLPPHCIGNLITTTIAKLPLDKQEGDDYNYLAGKLHGSIRKVIEQYKTNVHEGGGEIEGLSKSKIFHISDWSKLPYYEADFGWGKPMWVTNSGPLLNTAVLIDTCNGEGVEAWILLPKDEDMAKFQDQPEIKAYASFD